MTLSSVLTVREALAIIANIRDTSNTFYTTETKNKNIPEFGSIPSFIRLLANKDPFSRIVTSLTKDSITTVFTEETTLLKSLPHLHALKNHPVIINVDLDLQDYSIISALRDLNYFSLISNSPADAIENAKLAFELSIKTGQPVLHFITTNTFHSTSPLDKQLNVDSLKTLEVSESEDTGIEDFLSDRAFHVLNETQNGDTVVINLSPYGKKFSECASDSNVSVIDINIYNPWSLDKLLQVIPPSVSRIIVAQGASKESETNGFEPLLLNFFSDFNKLVERNISQVILSNIGILADSQVKESLEFLIANVKKEQPNPSLFLGKTHDRVSSQYSSILSSSIRNVLNLENAYLKVLTQTFSGNLKILNEYSSSTVNANTPEYGFGHFLNENENRQKILKLAKKSLDPSLFNSTNSNKLVQALSSWISFHEKALSQDDLIEANKVADEIFSILVSEQNSKAALDLLKLVPTVDSLLFKSNWLIGSDAWSYDLGNSGVHQVIASNQNINMLIIDSEPYEKQNKSDELKKNIGLYAMNYHDVYVASIAIYSSYTQMLTALIEASRFNGPSVVLAYLPYNSEQDTPLEILKETKKAVESGYWPLYRYDPTKEITNSDDAFSLDSAVIKRELKDFLDRENRLTVLSRKLPEFANNLKHSASDAITRKQEKRAKAAFDKLLEGLSGPPLHIYYASDGGNGSGLATRLSKRASARGLKATALSMDDIILEDLASEENVVFITSTAGQGEFPQDGKAFWDELKSSTDLDLASLNFSVFGLGDSQYWPRKEDARYFNKPAKDLFARMELLTANPIVPIGLGDDQDDDGYQTKYSIWENSLWEALGVSGADIPEEKPYTNEDMKINSNFLRGTIVEGLNDKETLAIHPYDQQLTKFHGCYMQDDRDIREIRKSQGLEPLYSFMTRVRLPGGNATPDQWEVMDRIANEVGNGTIKITTRATFQLHGILKKNLKHAIRAMNSTLMDTLAACGDVNRNVMVSALPANAKVHSQISKLGAEISEYFLPNTTAYHEIWLQGIEEKDYNASWPEIFESRKEGPTKKKTLVAGNTLVDVEPLYSPVYLPRKFKVNITVPPYNDVDVFSSDVGLIAIVDQETQTVKGYNMYVGGGMGTTHNNKKTYPRTGSLLGFVVPEDVIPAIKSVMILQRDNGSRSDRKHARLKYTIDDIGAVEFKKMVEDHWGKTFGPEQVYEIKSNIDYFGWVKDENGLNHFTAFVENGRVIDTPEKPQKTGFKRISQYMKETGSGYFRLTGNQHVLICGIKDEHLDGIKRIMKEYVLDNTELSGLRMSSSSCVGLPTCGLAMAESERYLPVLIDQIEDILEEFGLRHDSIVMRMTGCPNGCARPWLAELALIGKAPNTYNLMLGGGYYGQRLNKLYRASVKDEDVLDIIKPLLKRWALEREEGEHFGDFVVRVGIVKPTLEGKYFHDDISEDAY